MKEPMTIAGYRVKNATWGLAYSLFQVVQGLLVHPYQTMRQLVREKVFVWMAFSPVFLWMCAVIVWRILEVLLFSMIPFPSVWIFLALWFSVGIALYQVLLAYLLVRFSRIVE